MRDIRIHKMDKFNRELKTMALNAKKHSQLMDCMTDAGVMRFMHKECGRLMQNERPSRKLYEQLEKEKENGRSLSYNDISEDILNQLIYAESITIKEIAELFNTTRGKVSCINNGIGVADNDKALEAYKEYFKLACKNTKNMTKLLIAR